MPNDKSSSGYWKWKALRLWYKHLCHLGILTQESKTLEVSVTGKNAAVDCGKSQEEKQTLVFEDLKQSQTI